MAVFLARSECRNGLWHVVTYEISVQPWAELSAIATRQPCRGNEEPVVIGEPWTDDTPKPDDDQPGECEAASLKSYTKSWTSPTSYESVAKDQECPTPSVTAEVSGMRDARAHFLEVAERYCLESDCAEGELCLPQPPKIDVTLEGTVSRMVGDDKDCHLKFRISGAIECRCTPWQRGKRAGAPKTGTKPARTAKQRPRKKAAAKKQATRRGSKKAPRK